MDRKILTIYHSNGNIGMKVYFTKYFILQEITFYYKNGNLQTEIKESFMKHYYKNGKLQMEANYKDEKKQAVERTYHKNGKLKEEKYYINGILQNVKDSNLTLNKTIN